MSLKLAAWFDPTLPSSLVDELWNDPEGLMRTGDMLKQGDRCTVVKLHHPDGALVLKRYNLKGSLHTALHWFMRSRARWCWVNARLAARAGLPTPAPLACLDERRLGLLRQRSYFLTSFIPGLSLRDLVEKKLANESKLRHLADQFVRIWGKLGTLRIGHGDMKASNFIVDPAGTLWMIDLDGMRMYGSNPLYRRERRNDLECFLYNWQKHPDVAAIFRTRLGAT